uniref:DUF3276 family protein n=1 Tax=Haemonchus contortus TaxID=6289 RepID=A0A7I4YU58_HAECO
MENPSRPVCLIENAIDRLIEYGDRIHAAHKYADEHKEKVHSKHGTPHYGCPKTRSRSSIHSERRSGYTTKKSQSMDILVSKPGKQSQTTSKRGKQPQMTPYQSFLASQSGSRPSESSNVIGAQRSCSCTRSSCYCTNLDGESEEFRTASPTASESVVSEKQTVNNFVYTVMKGDRRCTIPGKMLSKRLPDSWIQVEFMLYDEDGTQLLELRTEVFGEALRNTFVNGKSVEFM